MASIATITPQKTDPITGMVIRKAKVSVPKRYSPPNRMPTTIKKFRNVTVGGSQTPNPNPPSSTF
jgi:hypothetical protein